MAKGWNQKIYKQPQKSLFKNHSGFFPFTLFTKLPEERNLENYGLIKGKDETNFLKFEESRCPINKDINNNESKILYIEINREGQTKRQPFAEDLQTGITFINESFKFFNFIVRISRF